MTNEIARRVNGEWVTPQLSLFGEDGWDLFSGTWPTAGTTRSGTAYQRRPLAPRTCVTASSSSPMMPLPTPTASAVNDHVYPSPALAERFRARGRSGSFVEAMSDVLFPNGLWPTPCANDDNKSPEAHLAMKARMPGGPRSTITSLQVAVKALELWPTPNSTRRGPDYERLDGGGSSTGDDLATAVARQLWPTPSTKDRGNDPPARQGAPSLGVVVRRWPTPQARDGDGRGPGADRWLDPTKSNNLDDAVAHMDGLQGRPTALLNPSWVEALMGFPPGWTDLGSTASNEPPPESPTEPTGSG